jgi:hypothetical protein
MIFRTLVQLGALLLLVSMSASIPLAGAQDGNLAIEKILNPMPEYDPFEKSGAPPQYFPDETDKRARELMIDALTHRKEATATHVKALRAEDNRLKQQQGTVTGLTEHAQDLVNNTIADREAYIAAQKEALKNARSPERRKYLEAIINHDDLNQSDRLMRQSSANFWAGFANRLLGSVDLVGVASGNFVGAAAETTVSQLYALLDRDMAPEERRALARNLDHLKRFPDDPRNAAIRKDVESLDKKKKHALARKQIDKAKEALAKGDFERADFYTEMAELLDGQSKEAEKIRQQARTAARQREAARKNSLIAVAEPNRSADQQADVTGLLYALSLRDGNQVQKIAVELDRKYQGTPLADAAKDAEAVGLEINGRHEAAKKAVAEILRYSRSNEQKQRAAALLASPEYNLLETFQDARAERQLQSVQYVLLGEDLLRKNLLFAAGAAAAGPGAAAMLGMANAMMMGTNLYQVMTNNPISAQPVIDAGVVYVRSHPSSENSTEIYRVLADAFEERGLYDKAISYHELAGSPKDKITALQDKSAKALLDAAATTNQRDAREYYLTRVIDQHPGTPAAARATSQLAALAKEENQGLRMSKQFLREYPELYGPRGLGLKASLFDGRAQNMEIAERGVNLINDNELLVYYQTPWGVRQQIYPLPKSVSERFFIALREKNLQVAMSDVNLRAKDTVGGIRNLPGAVVRADRERRAASSEATSDTTFTLVREADPGATYPSVLDARMVSENERDPSSKYRLPPISGSISARRFSMTGALPAGLWSNQLAIGGDHRSPFAGIQLPIPLLEGFIPVDFMIQGRPGGISLYPRIRTGADTGSDPELYR